MPLQKHDNYIVKDCPKQAKDRKKELMVELIS